MRIYDLHDSFTTRLRNLFEMNDACRGTVKTTWREPSQIVLIFEMVLVEDWLVIRRDDSEVHYPAGQGITWTQTISVEAERLDYATVPDPSVKE